MLLSFTVLISDLTFNHYCTFVQIVLHSVYGILAGHNFLLP